MQIMRGKGEGIDGSGAIPTLVAVAAKVTTATAAPRRHLLVVSMKTRGERKRGEENANTVKRGMLAMVPKENQPQGRMSDVEKTRSEVVVKVLKVHRRNPTQV